jgi:transposase
VREILNTILYQNHTGCPWDMLPHDLSPKSTAYDFYKAWQDQGVWGLLVDTLRGRIRVTTPRVGAQAEGPALVDTQAQGRAVAEAQGEGPAAAAGARREETPSALLGVAADANDEVKVQAAKALPRVAGVAPPRPEVRPAERGGPGQGGGRLGRLRAAFIAQAARFVESGAADLGIIALVLGARPCCASGGRTSG